MATLAVCIGGSVAHFEEEVLSLPGSRGVSHT
jgi:hypothetical protein